MKTIIAGSRNIRSYVYVATKVSECNFRITEIVSGCAQGVDQLGETYARAHRIPIKKFPANWARHGRAAGPIRNLEMAKYADSLIAIWDGKSAGTKNMIELAKHMKLKVKVIICKHPCES